MLNKQWISFNNIVPGDSRAMLSQSAHQYQSIGAREPRSMKADLKNIV